MMSSAPELSTSAPVLEIRGLTKRFGGLLATDNVDLTLRPREIHAIIGPNGAGKTTLISQITGQLRPDSGTIRLADVDVTHMPPHRRAQLGMARSFQITNIFDELTVIDNVALAVQARAGHSFRFWRDARNDDELRKPAFEVLSRFDFAGQADRAAGHLAHGDRRILEVAMELAKQPKLLLLDEPMAGMGTDESMRMLRLLERLGNEIAILLVEHDMDAVFALADRISVLVFGRVIACGPPDVIRADASVREAYLGENEAS